METMELTVGSLLVPGVGSAKKALIMMNKLREDMHECEDLSGRLLCRLLETFKQLRALEKEQQAAPREALESYGRLLGKCVGFMKTHLAKHLYLRLLHRRSTMEEIRALHEQLDAISQRLSIVTTAWETRWEIDVETHVVTLGIMIDNSEFIQYEMGDEPQQHEAMMTLKFELENRMEQHTPEEHEMIQKLFAQIQRLSKIEEIVVPSWFIPQSDVASESKSIAECSSGSLRRGLWNSRAVVILLLKTETVSRVASSNQAKIVNMTDAYNELSHPHVVQIAGANHVTSQPFVVLETTANETLAMYLQSLGKDEVQIKWWCLYEAALGLEHLHSKGMIHGALTLDSFLVGEDGVVQLMGSMASGIITQAGRLRWRAPECLEHRPTTASDIYSLGMCILQAFSGEPPYACVDDSMVYCLLRDGKMPRRPEAMPDHVWNLIQAMTTHDPLQRCSLATVISSLGDLIRAQELKELVKEVDSSPAEAPHTIVTALVKDAVQTALERVVAVKTQELTSDAAGDSCVPEEPTDEIDDEESDTSYSEDEYESYKTGTDDDRSDSPRSVDSEESQDSENDDQNLDFDDVLAGFADVSSLLPDNATESPRSRNSASCSALPMPSLGKEDAVRGPVCTASREKPVRHDGVGEMSDTRTHIDKNRDAIAHFIRQLEHVDRKTQRAAAQSLRHFASSGANHEAIVHANGIGALLRVLHDETHNSVDVVADTLVLLAENGANDDAFAHVEAIDTLVKMAAFCTHAFIPSATAVLSALANRESNRQRIAQAGGVRVLIVLVKGRSCGGVEQTRAATVIGRLARDCSIRGTIVAAGGLAPLIVLHLRGTAEQQFEALVALQALLKDEPKYQGRVVNDSACYRILHGMLRGGNQEEKEEAINAIVELARHSTSHQQIVDAGIHWLLISLVRGAGTDRRQRAAVVLTSLAANETNHSFLMRFAGVSAFLSLMHVGSDTEKQIAAQGVRRLSVNRRCRKAIVQARGVPILLDSLVTTDLLLTHEVTQVLLNLADDYCETIADAGAVPLVVALLECDGEEIKAGACGLLSKFANIEDKRMQIVQTGGFAPLVKIVRTSSGQAEASAAAALVSLMKDAEVRRTVRDMGFMDTLQELATSGSPDQAEAHRAMVKAMRCEIM